MTPVTNESPRLESGRLSTIQEINPMSTEIVPFDFQGVEVRTVLVDNEPWWVASDVAAALGLANGRNMVARLDLDEKGVHLMDTLGGAQSMAVINESGLYSAIIRSDSMHAAPFKRWVTHEVLPSIRKTGTYSMTPALTEDQIVQQALTIMVAKTAALEAKITADAPKVLFADSVAASKTTILVGELAKILRGNGVEIGQNRLFDLLREEGYLIKRHGTDRNMPTQYSMELGLFEIKETAVTHADGHVTISKTPKVTGKGQAYFVNRYAAGTEMAVAS